MSDPPPHVGARPAARRTLHLEAAAVETIRRHARECAPAECCGALIGLFSSSAGREASARAAAAPEVVRVARVLAARNVAPDDRHYVVAPADVLRAEAEAAEVGLEVVGYYHSHAASEPVPSPTDLETAWPWYSYLIVAASTGELRAWQLAEDRSHFREEELRVSEASG